MSAVRQLKILGYMNHDNAWVPYHLTEKKLTDPFLKKIAIGDEKWLVYSNVKEKSSWGKQDEPQLTSTKAASLHDDGVISNSIEMVGGGR